MITEMSEVTVATYNMFQRHDGWDNVLYQVHFQHLWEENPIIK